jgi:hypothetical protein
MPPAGMCGDRRSRPLGTFLQSLVFFALFYAPLRLLHENWKRLALPPWFIYPIGIFSWGVALSLLGPPYALISLFGAVLKRPDVSAGLEIGAVLILVSLLAKTLVDHPEILKWDQMKPFLQHSLVFRNYHAEHIDIFQELENKRINDIHREISGNDIPEVQRKVKALPHSDPEQAKRELEKFRAQPLQSAHLKTELEQLKLGATIDITDTFKINVLKRPTHTLYAQTYDMDLDPAERILRFKVNFTNITVDTKFSAERLFRVKQEAYDLLQALVSEEWLKPYAEFFDSLFLTCFRVQPDGFDLPQQFPFMSIQIPVKELRVREGRIYSVADLHTISVITMHDKQ